MRPRQHAAALWLLAAGLAGACGQEDDARLPAACASDGGTVRVALAAAPRPVRVEGEPISACLTRSSDAADVQEVGATYLRVASRLADTARTRPEGAEALRLGYLMGAVRRGAARTAGIHSELLRRLEQEVRDTKRSSRQFERGERAGRASG